MSGRGSAIDYINGILHVDEIDVRGIAAKVGTPCYVYSAAHMRRQYHHLERALGALRERTLVCYAMKANSNQAVVTLFTQLGAGADLVTGGELERAVAAGVDPQKIVFSGIGKTDEDIRRAIHLRIRQVNVESLGELRIIDRIAGELGEKAHVAFRLNPQLDTLERNESKITTGKPDSKFGIPWPAVLDALESLGTLPHLCVRGISVHIGSNFQQDDFNQIERTFDELVNRYLPVFLKARNRGQLPDFDTIDLGGGIGIRYGMKGDAYDDPLGENELFTKYGALLQDRFAPILAAHPFLRLVLEPGRSLVGNAGVLVTRVVNVKKELQAGPIPVVFLVVDAAMNDLLRPGLYGSFHEIRPVRVADDTSGWWDQTDICGPACETTDSFCRATAEALHLDGVDRDEPIDRTAAALNVYGGGEYHEQIPPYMTYETDGRQKLKYGYFVRRRFPEQSPGDLVAILSAGAYGAVMASEYNTRPLVPEVLVDGSRWSVIRSRPSVAEIISRDSVPEWMTKQGS
jgi:diaminopimelate decarboxylase